MKKILFLFAVAFILALAMACLAAEPPVADDHVSFVASDSLRDISG